MTSIGRALIAIALLPATVLAGANRGEDNFGPLPDEGPGYFGVVLDAAGKPVDDARVSAAYRDGPAMVTRTNAAGTWKLPGFNKRINPDEVKMYGHSRIDDDQNLTVAGDLSALVDAEYGSNCHAVKSSYARPEIVAKGYSEPR